MLWCQRRRFACFSRLPRSREKGCLSKNGTGSKKGFAGKINEHTTGRRRHLRAASRPCIPTRAPIRRRRAHAHRAPRRDATSWPLRRPRRASSARARLETNGWKDVRPRIFSSPFAYPFGVFDVVVFFSSFCCPRFLASEILHFFSRRWRKSAAPSSERTRGSGGGARVGGRAEKRQRCGVAWLRLGASDRSACVFVVLRERIF